MHGCDPIVAWHRLEAATVGSQFGSQIFATPLVFERAKMHRLRPAPAEALEGVCRLRPARRSTGRNLPELAIARF